MNANNSTKIRNETHVTSRRGFDPTQHSVVALTFGANDLTEFF